MKIKKLFYNGIVVFFALTFLFTPVLAEDTVSDEIKEQETKLQENKSKQQELLNEINRIRGEKTSLANQVAYLESQIGLTELQIQIQSEEIQKQEEEVGRLTLDIEDLSGKIERVKEYINSLEVVLEARVRSSYKKNQIGGGLSIVFQGKDDLQDLVYRYQYLKTVQDQDSRLLQQMKETQAEYDSQISSLETKKDEVEVLKESLKLAIDQLQVENENLLQQRYSKDYLLRITQNDEARYQDLLTQTIAEKNAIQSAISGLLEIINNGKVQDGEYKNRGDRIGYQGMTGSATGPHVHFMVLECVYYSCHTNPKPFLESGLLGWPLEQYEITQEYGITDWGLATGTYADVGNIHNGLDIAWDAENVPVLAAESGYVHYFYDRLGGNCAAIYHAEDMVTWYCHLK